MKFITRVLAAAALCLSALSTHAQTDAWPGKPIRIVLPLPAGGSFDSLARALAQKLTPVLGQTVLVDNKSGGGTVIGWDNVAKAAPDGYTVLLAGIGGRVILPSIATLPFDPVKDLVAVTRVANSTSLLVVNPTGGVRTLAELVAKAKAQPGKLNMGLPGTGSFIHLAMTEFQRDVGISLTEVLYRGGPDASQAVLKGEIDLMPADSGAVLAQVQAGKLLALAVTDSNRLASLPNVPTTAEAGYPKLSAVSMWGLYAPAGTPAPIVEKIAAAVAQVVKQPDLQQMFAPQGMTLVSSTPAEFERLNREQTLRWAPLAKASGLRLN